MATEIKKRSENISSGQKTALIDFLESHPKLKCGKFESSFKYADANSLWQSASETLNSIPGSTKDWKGWRKCWADMRSEVRAKVSAIKRHIGGIGGGRPLKITLTEHDERIRNVIGETTIVGHATVPESEINLMLQPNDFDAESIIVYDPDPDIFATDPELNVTQAGNSINSNTNTNTNTRKRPCLATQRLQNTINIAEMFAASVKNKSDVKEAYYKKKLELL